MTPRYLITIERLDEPKHWKCPTCKGRGFIGPKVKCHRCNGEGWLHLSPPKLVDEPAETLRTRARNGERRPEGLSGLYMRAWIMGAAEAADKRNRRVA